MNLKNLNPCLTFFFATSGHSGVDRLVKNLLIELASREIQVNLLKIHGHGPYIDEKLPGLQVINFQTSHVNSAYPALVDYLRTVSPPALLTDKDRVNRIALWARHRARVSTRLVIRVGTTVSENLARRGFLHRFIQYYSIRHFYPWADAIVVPSEGAASDLIKIGNLRKELVKVIPSPVITGKMLEQADQPFDHPWLRPNCPPVILGAGELCARKDFATLIRAFAIVRKQRDCRLIILGKGRQKDSLLRLAGELEVDTDVSFPGFVTNPYVFMKKASVFILSSRCEGAPVVLMEAIGLGTPVVSTDCPSGPREILMGGKLGPLVPMGDPDAMAKAIVSVLDNPPDRDILKRAARRFTVKESVDKYLSVLGFPI